MKKTQEELMGLLSQLIDDWESEIVEFKQANTNYDTDKIGDYFSALANEANLANVNEAWLVFGVEDRTRTVVGTNYRMASERLNNLKWQLNQATTPGVSFKDIHVLEHPDGRVILFEIPPAPQGLPIAWKGNYKARAGESLVPLGLDKQDQIRNQARSRDWTSEVVPDARLTDLDPDAIQRARQGFAERHQNNATAIQEWDDRTFLDKTRITISGQVTRAALLLLGKRESAYLLSPCMPELVWNLVGEQRAYEQFSPPFLLTATQLIKRIRNVQIRLNPPNELIYREIQKYNESSLHEALYNCIAHQDYRLGSRVIVTEQVDRLEFVSAGSFVDETPESYMLGERVPRRYRNPFLVSAMTELNLIDHMGNGIHRMFDAQRKRFLPLPDYDLSVSEEVKLTVFGAVIDPAYSELLMSEEDLPLEDVLALDRVQKGMDIGESANRRLRRRGLIEGRKPHRTITARVAKTTDSMADYIRTRPQADRHYAALLEDFLRAQGSASRSDIDSLLRPALSEALSEEQKTNKVNNLLTKFRKQGLIVNKGSRSGSRWELS